MLRCCCGGGGGVDCSNYAEPLERNAGGGSSSTSR